MGFYINPANGDTKEKFLEQYGEPLVFAPNEYFDFSGDSLPVCWISNGMFTAAGIAYNKSELHAFKAPSDKRQKLWFLVKKEHLEAKVGLPIGWINEIQSEERNG